MFFFAKDVQSWQLEQGLAELEDRIEKAISRFLSIKPTTLIVTIIMAV